MDPSGRRDARQRDAGRGLRSVAELDRGVLALVRVLASDVDGTITTGDHLQPSTVAAFEELDRVGCPVVLVTGRSAGWAAALAHYLPGLAGVVAENGAVLFLTSSGEQPPILLDPESTAVTSGSASASASAADVEAIDACFAALRTRYPRLRPGVDNFCRLTDRTFDVDPEIDPTVVRDVAAGFGLAHTYSTVHHHLSSSRLTKRTGLLAALDRHLAPGLDPATDVVTIGDSVNDAPLFDRSTFAATVGVAGVVRHLGALGGSAPGFVTAEDGGRGFGELAALIVAART